MSRSTMPSQPQDATVDAKRPSYRAVPPSVHPPPPRRSAPRVEIGDAEDTLRDARVPWPEPPAELKDRPRDSRSGIALSRTLRPLAAGLRSFSLVHALALAALALAGIALFLARTTPPESVGAVAARPTAREISAPAEPSPASPPAAVTATARHVASKPPINVNSLPVAPPPVVQPLPRAKPIVRPPASTTVSPASR
jgi:hypothetical protein